MQSIGTFGTAVVIALVYSWKYTLGFVSIAPLIGISNMLRFKMSTRGLNAKEQEDIEKAGKVRYNSRQYSVPPNYVIRTSAA